MRQFTFNLALFVCVLGSVLNGQAEPYLFEPPVLLTEASPLSVAVGDFDQDGRPDLAVAEVSPGGIRVFRQTLPDAFSSATVIGQGLGFEALEAADFDGDGALDLIAVDRSSPSSLYVAFGDGAGAFALSAPVSLSGVAEAVHVRDLNGDGVLDLVIALSDVGQLAVLVGTPNGNLGTPIAFPALNGAKSLDLGDIDGDGALDAIVTSSVMGLIAVLSGDGVGNFGPPTLLSAYQSERALLADLDGDGDLDIVGVASVVPSLITFENTGAGFGPVQTQGIVGSGISLVLRDMDGDGILDAVVGPGGIQQVVFGYVAAVYSGDGAGSFSGLLTQTYGNSSFSDQTDDLVVHDMDGDGIGDVVAILSQRNGAMIFHRDGTGGPRLNPDSFIGNQPRAFRLVDIDGDGILDLFSAKVALQANGLSIALGVGDGTFVNGLPVGSAAEDLELADFNSDGNLDVLYRDTNGVQLRIRLGNGDGTFGLTSCLNGGRVYDSFDVGLIDSDTAPDMVAVSNGDANVLIALGDGLGALMPGGQLVPLGGSPLDVNICDLDGDGDQDAVITDQSMPGLILLSNDGLGDLSTRTDIPLPTALGTVVQSADLDKDGFVDLVTDGNGELLVLFGSGGGAFAPALSVVTPGTSPFVLGDVNRDGWLDLVGDANDLVGIALADGLGGFRTSYAYGSKTQVRGIAVGDVNGDGWGDVVELDSSTGHSEAYVSYSPSLARADPRNGSGVNPLVFSSLTAPLLGTSWASTTDASGFPLATLSLVVLGDRGLRGLGSPFGELLIALAPLGLELDASLQAISAGSATHSFPIPSDTALTGMFVTSQAALIGSGVSLTNAIDLVLGDR